MGGRAASGGGRAGVLKNRKPKTEGGQGPREAGLNLLNLGYSGQCHLDQAVARTIRDLDGVAAISLKLGIASHRKAMLRAVHT